jgi:protein-L-isoaspartate(D-aspartate) O-methyltransferase
MAINLDDYGGADVFRWTHEYLYEYLTSGKHKIIRQPLLKNAFNKVLREDFVPDELRSRAYEDTELDIGFGEIINKPTVVAKMLSLLKPRLGGRYLDLGTGSGWTAALLGMAVGDQGQVFSVERMQFMVDIARMNLSKYPNIKNAFVIFRDGREGLPDYAPFDGIHVAFAYKELPSEVAGQLKIGGTLVAPKTNKELVVLERISEDEYKETLYGGYLFEEAKTGIE